jgi:WD40 repeat protein
VRPSIFPLRSVDILINPILAKFCSRGSLLSGDCAGHIYLWEPREWASGGPSSTSGGNGSAWTVDLQPFVGHTDSVEDLQWSPNERDVRMTFFDAHPVFLLGWFDCFRLAVLIANKWQPIFSKLFLNFCMLASYLIRALTSCTALQVFMSCGVDRTVRVWDVRTRARSMVHIVAHDSDVNVISWNRYVSCWFFISCSISV